MDLDDNNQEDLNQDISETQYDMQECLKVLEVIASQKASYQSEIANKKGLDPSKVGMILHKLKEEGLVEVLKPSLGYMDDPRLLDQRHKRQSLYNGIDSFNNPTWFALNSDLDWVLKVDRWHGDGDKPEYVDENGEPVNGDALDKSSSDLLSERMNVV